MVSHHEQYQDMTPSASSLTPLTRAGRLIAKGLSKIITPGNALQFKVETHKVFAPNLPDEFENFRVVQLSDIHFYEFGCTQYYQAVVDAVNKLEPDLIVTTGDIIHYGQHYLGMSDYYLKQLQAKHGKWACMGNHDYDDDYRGMAVQAMLQSAGFTPLTNNAGVIEHEGKRLWLSGLDDMIKGVPDVDKACAHVEPEAFHLALAHNPRLGPLLNQQAAAPNLILSGHTHGGQVNHFLVRWFQKHIFHQKYQYGWFPLGQSNMYVTSGVGSAAISFHLPHFDFAMYPFRVDTLPEIAVFDLTSMPIVCPNLESQLLISA